MKLEGLTLTKDVTTIQVKKTTREKLDSLGVRRESYDDIILRLIAEHEQKAKK